MSGIAGIAAGGKGAEVNGMLQKMAHRGREGSQVIEWPSATLGLAWTKAQAATAGSLADGLAEDRASDSRFASAQVAGDGLMLHRDPLGVAPLYYGRTSEGDLCFASEVKALLPLTSHVIEFPAGYSYLAGQFSRYFQLRTTPPVDGQPHQIAAFLRQRLHAAVDRRMLAPGITAGVWLSGGLDSSAVAALARPLVPALHTFTVGLADAPDIKYARAVAAALKTEHHEILVRRQDLEAVLVQVIYHLESFDVRVVRSGLVNWLAGRAAAEYVAAVLSGEGVDEIFAGYPYLDDYGYDDLPAELLSLVGTIHNTSLQRADRCAAAHGLVAYVPFSAGPVVDYALRIPVGFKRRRGVRKWILREALADCVPERVLTRKQARSFEGAGTGSMMAELAEQQVSDADLRQERVLHNGWVLQNKEEVLYYRIFREHFGVLEELSWMGRSKGASL